MKTKEELIALGLPKWPQCLINGKSITRKQALEIIRRTDALLTSVPYISDRQQDRYAKYVIETLQIPHEDKNTWSVEAIEAEFEIWAKNFGAVPLNYLRNDWVSCNCVQGAQGWCHPDGTIEYHYNIGKWPEVSEVLEDLNTIATTWPFLDFSCTLMGEEYCVGEGQPIISFVVKDGTVEIVDPESLDVKPVNNWHITDDGESEKFKALLETGYSSEIPKEVIESWKQFVKVEV